MKCTEQVTWLLYLSPLLYPLTTHARTPPVEPSFLQISSIPQIPKVEKLLVLCCRVENFFPKHIDLEWSRNDGEQVRSISHFGFLKLTPNEDNWGSEFQCHVVHTAQKEPEERLFRLPNLHLTNGY
uniref:Ig-like domain-containing protein n=1 Tax=Monopterus albus TaxID=43700 RepID=A0A3Q3K525_MONAL